MNNFELKVDFKDFTDENLIKMFKNGNKAAFDEIVRRYSAAVSAISRQYSANTLTAEDWFQEGMLGLIKAVFAFNASGGAAFATFASVCIRNSLNSAYRKAHNSKNAPFLNTKELDDCDFPPVSSPEEDYISQEQYKIFTDGFTKQLSAAEWEVFCCHLSGNTTKQTAAQLKITEKAAENALYRAKTKLKKALKPN